MLQVFFSPINESNNAFIYEAEISDDCYLWTNRNKPVSQRAFYEDLKKREMEYYQTFFVIRDKTGRSPIGFIYSYGTSFTDGYCYVTVYIAPEYRRLGAGAIAGAKFLDYLFSRYNFRKIYFDVFDYNMPSQKLLLNAGCIEEGLFKDHKYYGNRFHSLHRFALYKEDFYIKSAHILKCVTKAN